MRDLTAGRARWGAWIGWFLTVLLIVQILGFYHWIYRTNRLSNPEGMLYNLSVDGYLAGQLSFVVKPDPGLLALANPYDPVQNAPFGMRETSLYDGKYYLYFGPTPAVTLFLPLRLAGITIRDGMAVMIFGSGTFLLGVLVLLRFRSVLKVRAYYPLLLGMAVLGLNTYFGHFLRRPEVFEVAISGAVFWLMFAVYFMVTYFAKGGGQGWYLALSGLGIGLAIGARYSYALCSVMLLLPAMHLLWGSGGRSREKYVLAFRRLLAGAVPWACVVGLLVLHNYLRFDDPLEFGQRYQMTGVNLADLKLMSASFIPHNFNVYFLSWINPDGNFPFFHEYDNATIREMAQPPVGYHMVWNSVGVFNSPFLLFALGAPLVLWLGRSRAGAVAGADGARGFMLLSVMIPAAVNILVLLMFCGIVVRYVLDFVPLLALLACFVYLLAESALKGLPRIGLRVAAGVLVLYGVAVNVGLSMEGEYQVFRRNYNPAKFAEMERMFGSIPRIWFREQDYGPVVLKVRFPARKEGKSDPLVLTGRKQESDLVAVSYPDEKTIRFWFLHDLGEPQGIKSDPIAIDPAKEYLVEISMGSLFPHALPFLESRGYFGAQQKILQVKLDGRIVMQGEYAFYDSVPSRVLTGRNRPVPPDNNPNVFSQKFFNPVVFNQAFSGEILQASRAPFLQPQR